MDNIINIKGLSKRYRQVQALDDINLQIPKGRIVGLLGKNGAGKSTLLKCMLDFLNYDGEIEFFNKNVKDWNYELHKKVAFIPDVSGLDPRLTVRETLEYVAGINPSFNKEKAEHLFEKSELPSNRKVKTLSKGMKTKLYLLLTLAKDVDVLLLDEPTLGLDIVFRQEFYDLLLGEFFDENKTVIISTHQVAEVENILHDVIFIDNGSIVLHQDMDKLKEEWSIIELPSDKENELRKMGARSIVKSFGKVRGIVNKKAKGIIPSVSDIFVAMLGREGENHETV